MSNSAITGDLKYMYVTLKVISATESLFCADISVALSDEKSYYY